MFMVTEKKINEVKIGVEMLRICYFDADRNELMWSDTNTPVVPTVEPIYDEQILISVDRDRNDESD